MRNIGEVLRLSAQGKSVRVFNRETEGLYKKFTK
jgi:hypothetical protein